VKPEGDEGERIDNRVKHKGAWPGSLRGWSPVTKGIEGDNFGFYNSLKIKLTGGNE
jgi:hypothetical protein